jgi:hypothetical protein
MDLLLHPQSGSWPDAPPVPASPPAPVPAPEPPRASRCKLWDLHHKYHCPVIGTCLEVAELRRIAARARQHSDGPLSDFEVHLSFVGAADTKNALSIATHKDLERKYAAAVGRFAKVRDTTPQR